MPLKQNMMAVGKSETAVAIKPSFEDVGVGKYKLVVETVEANSNRSVTLATDLEFR